MHTNISYANMSRHEADAEAIRDVVEWLPPEGFTRCVELARAGKIATLNIAMGFAGITGYPFHALARTINLAAYREWMHEGDDAVPTDEEGFAR